MHKKKGLFNTEWGKKLKEKIDKKKEDSKSKKKDAKKKKD